MDSILLNSDKLEANFIMRLFDFNFASSVLDCIINSPKIDHNRNLGKHVYKICSTIAFLESYSIKDSEKFKAEAISKAAVNFYKPCKILQMNNDTLRTDKLYCALGYYYEANGFGVCNEWFGKIWNIQKRDYDFKSYKRIIYSIGDSVCQLYYCINDTQEFDTKILSNKKQVRLLNSYLEGRTNRITFGSKPSLRKAVGLIFFYGGIDECFEFLSKY